MAGKTEAVTVYELLALKGNLPAHKRETVERYHEALALYRQTRFAEAAAVLEARLAKDAQDGPTAALLARCRKYEETPPPPRMGWGDEPGQVRGSENAMRKRARRLVAALALCAASTALAAGASDPTLYVKARNTRLMASASPTADVLAILQPGQKVTWKGADPKNKQWHQVVVDGKAGLVFQSNLAKQPPSMELVAKDGTRTTDTRGLVSSGAAIEACADGATQYGQEKGKKVPGFSETVTQVKQLENLAESITPQELAAHADKAHLFPVVGPQAAVSRGGKR